MVERVTYRAQRLRVCSAALGAVLIATGVLAGSAEGVLMLAPALLLGAALVSGRYVGEEAIARVRRLSPARRARGRARSRIVAVRPPARIAPRGGLLLAASLATRPPPFR
jgi:hypothetical protein